MRACYRTVYLLFFAALGCSDASGPKTTVGQFVLVDIDGHGVPATAPSGATFLDGSIHLDEAGEAVITHRIRWPDGSEITDITRYKYEISGSRISFVGRCDVPFGLPCPIDPTGEILSNRTVVKVILPPGAAPQVYTYQKSVVVD
jgi:hypothetical protein